MWLRTAALAAGAYLALGLAQPWRLLQRGAEPVDTSGWAVAVVIPTLNEASTIEATLRDVRGRLSPPPAEVIVVDGGSTDGTEAIARRSGLATRVLRTKRKGRARQMNAGAAAASSPLLVFLHADTRPPRGVVAAARRVLRDPRAVLGGFWPVIEGCPLLSANNFLSTYYGPALLRPRAFLAGMRVLFGDQTLFCRAADFARVGGFDARLRIMEDADLCVRLHEAGFSGGGRGRVVHVLDAGPSVTSGRRVGRWGGLYATWVHLRVSLAWYATRGADGAYERLERLYERLYTDDR